MEYCLFQYATLAYASLGALIFAAVSITELSHMTSLIVNCYRNHACFSCINTCHAPRKLFEFD